MRLSPAFYPFVDVPNETNGRNRVLFGKLKLAEYPQFLGLFKHLVVAKVFVPEKLCVKMSGVVLEYLSARTLIILISFLSLCQILSFLIGGFISPFSLNFERILSTRCLDEENDTEKWFYSRGKGGCDVEGFEIEYLRMQANNTVFTFQMPLPKDNVIYNFYPWQQYLRGALEPEISYRPDAEMEPSTTLILDAQLAYRNKDDPDDAWKPLASGYEKRTLECTVPEKKRGYYYHCSNIRLFELGSLSHDFYLLNIRFPMDHDKNTNQEVSAIDALWLVTVKQNKYFTEVWVSLKTMLFPITVGILIWFWRRVYQLSRSLSLLNYLLLFLGATLCFLNIPLEYLALHIDMPLVLISDIQHGIFYTALLSFWIIFTGEHLMIQDTDELSKIKSYWKYLTAIVIGFLFPVMFNICKHGTQLISPFYSVGASQVGANLALAFIILGGVSGTVYFLFLAYMIWEVFLNISAKRAVLPRMSSVCRLHYPDFIYRLKFLMFATLLCAAVTVIEFIWRQVSEGLWEWNESQQFKCTSAFLTGVYGTWNMYICTLMVLYAPSYKALQIDKHHDTLGEVAFNRFL